MTRTTLHLYLSNASFMRHSTRSSLMKLHNSHVLEFKRVVLKTNKFGINIKQISRSLDVPLKLITRIKASGDKINSTVIDPYIYRCSDYQFSQSIIFMNLLDLQRTEVDSSVIISMRKGITVKIDGLVFERIRRSEIEDEDLIY